MTCFGVLAPGNFRIVKNKTGGDPHSIETMVDSLKKDEKDNNCNIRNVSLNFLHLYRYVSFW